MLYKLRKSGTNWTCHVGRFIAVGSGSRPELAIRDWTRQNRLWKSAKR